MVPSSVALKWLAANQAGRRIVSNDTQGQPGVTSLCMMAFVAHGHVPGDGQYGQRLERATDFVLSCQKENGLITLTWSGGTRGSRGRWITRLARAPRTIMPFHRSCCANCTA